MAAKMTPKQFAEKYYKLKTYLYPQELNGGAKPPYVPPSGWTTLKADNYRLGSSSWADKFWYNDIAPQFQRGGTVTVKVWTIKGTEEEVTFLNSQPLKRHYHAPFVGKGSPEQVQIAVQLVYRFHRVSTPLEQFMQVDFVGLDCNGFVGNYYQKIVKEKDWKFANVNEDPGPTTLMDDLLALGEEVKGPNALAREGTYVLVWCDDYGNIKNPQKGVANTWGHVMITEPNTLAGPADKQTIHVVEATAAGDRKLRDTDYTIVSTKQITAKGRATTLFYVDRGDPKPMPVRMSRLKV